MLFLINTLNFLIIIFSILKEGSRAIKLGRRGRRMGEKRTLTTEQEAQVKQALIDKTPDQLKLPFALWTRDAVKLLIRQRFSLEMPVVRFF